MSIEELKQKLGVSDAVFEGTKAANGWKSGRQVEEKEFKEELTKKISNKIIDIEREDKKGEET